MVVNGQISETLPVLSGVPQVSVIGPLLFLIYMDGVMSVPLSQGSQITAYADDILLYRRITCQGVFAALQAVFFFRAFGGGGEFPPLSFEFPPQTITNFVRF